MSISDRYDDFQSDAVNAISNDFSSNLCGRFLLVIPTGGGKTYTAVKSINRLYDSNVLSKDKDKVFWVAHRKELLIQAEKTFSKYSKTMQIDNICGENVHLLMLSEMQSRIDDIDLKIVVIDEAHHGAANSYKKIFDRNNIGVLGLTATPTRHDGKPLEFEKESYSIGFPDLVKRGIILKPTIHTIEGETLSINDIDNDLEELNTASRNDKIINSLLKNTDIYCKVIVYVGTIKHAEDLYNILIDTDLTSHYQSISFIAGNSNSRNQDRTSFIEEEKLYDRSILVNVQVLTEGYDDPKVNTVVMATPTKSKLYYMQAMGRAIRLNPEDILKKAYIVEVVDSLPNIRYRIDNRWLYSDVSDTLEPAVIDLTYSNENSFFETLEKLKSEYKICNPIEDVNFNPDYRYSILLFKRYLSDSHYDHFSILITNDNRMQSSNMFNFISERAAKFRSSRYNNHETIFNSIGKKAIELTESSTNRRFIFDAMMNASLVCDSVIDAPNFVKLGYPWLSFVTLNYKQDLNQIPLDLSEFLNDVINKEDIIEAFVAKSFEKGSSIIKLPLPLASYICKIITAKELDSIKAVVDKLNCIKSTKSHMDHRFDVDTVISSSVLPFEVMFCSSLQLIARDNLEYYYELGR